MPRHAPAKALAVVIWHRHQERLLVALLAGKRLPRELPPQHARRIPRVPVLNLVFAFGAGSFHPLGVVEREDGVVVRRVRSAEDIGVVRWMEECRWMVVVFDLEYELFADVVAGERAPAVHVCDVELRVPRMAGLVEGMAQVIFFDFVVAKKVMSIVMGRAKSAGMRLTGRDGGQHIAVCPSCTGCRIVDGCARPNRCPKWGQRTPHATKQSGPGICTQHVSCKNIMINDIINVRMIPGNAVLQDNLILGPIKVPLLRPAQVVHLLHERALTQDRTDQVDRSDAVATVCAHNPLQPVR